MTNFHEFTYSDCQNLWLLLDDQYDYSKSEKRAELKKLHPINFALFCEYLSKNRGEVASDYIKQFFQ